MRLASRLIFGLDTKHPSNIRHTYTTSTLAHRNAALSGLGTVPSFSESEKSSRAYHLVDFTAASASTGHSPTLLNYWRSNAKLRSAPLPPPSYFFLADTVYHHAKDSASAFPERGLRWVSAGLGKSGIIEFGWLTDMPSGVWLSSPRERAAACPRAL